uniref:Uncharacterized protein n=1 Tax=Pseudonaja textilis TaxID=8673 RepID=A0A670Z3N3_PSETE
MGWMPEELKQEATCPLCLDFFKQPMSLSCGHSFCRDCLALLGAEASCPQCRAKVEPSGACPSWVLANVVCLVKKLQLPEGAQEESSGQQLCQEHRQPLQIFCSSEKSLLCPGCLGKHQGHPLLSLPEAAQEYKVGTNSLGHSVSSLAGQAQESPKVPERWEELLGRSETQPVWLGWLAEQEEKMEAEWGVALAQISRKASGLQQLMDQTKRKYHQPEGEFLQVRGWGPSLASRGESRGFPGGGETGTLVKAGTHFSLLLFQDIQVYITLNGSTAHPQLWCQGSSVTWANRFQDCPDVPERFDQELCVLGSEGFTTGWHWWEVSVQGPYNFPVQGEVSWAIGVAKESIPRKGSFKLSSQVGIWAVGNNVWGQMIAFEPYRVTLQSSPRRLWVRLDCEAKEVQILDAVTGASLYTFKKGPFFGEMFRPFFYLGQMGVTLQCVPTSWHLRDHTWQEDQMWSPLHAPCPTL